MFLEAWRKRRATRDYARRLPKLLAKDYGASQSYTPVQVKRTIDRYNMNSEYSCYGLSMFCDREEFDQYHHTLGESCNYDGMRAEIAATHFDGNVDFTMSDIVQVFSDSSDDAGSGHGVAGGHAHGGDGFGHSH
jgi:hypothetical protein